MSTPSPSSPLPPHTYLGDDAHLGAQVLQADGLDVDAVNDDGALLGLHHAEEGEEDGGLAAAGATDEANLRGEREGMWAFGRLSQVRVGGREAIGSSSSSRLRDWGSEGPTFSPGRTLNETPLSTSGMSGRYLDET